MSAVYRAVETFDGASPIQKLAEAARVIGFIHTAYGELPDYVPEAELRERLLDVLAARHQYFGRPKRHLAA